MTVTLFGIKACDTMKKAFTFLDQAGIAYTFHDYKKSSIDAKHLRRWIDTFGWENVINRRGTSWRKLPEAEREAMDATGAIAAALANPSLIKRPLVEQDGTATLLGFNAEQWSAHFSR